MAMFPYNHDDFMKSFYAELSQQLFSAASTTPQHGVYQKALSFEDRLSNLKIEIDKCLDNGDKEKFAILSKQFNLMRMEA